MNIIKDMKNTHLSPSQCGIWYLGQEGFLFKYKEDFMLVDPYLSSYVDENCSELVEWRRMYQPPISAEELDFVSLVLCTHAHYDHADPYTLGAIAKASEKTKFVFPMPMKSVISEYGVDEARVIWARAGEKILLGDTKITPIPSAHEELHRDENGDYEELGYIIENPAGRFFHAGDMCPYEGLLDHLTDIDVAFLPINGRDDKRRSLDIIGNFTVCEAIEIAKECRARMIVPMHYDLYAVNCVELSEFEDEISRIAPDMPYRAFGVGEKYVYSK